MLYNVENLNGCMQLKQEELESVRQPTHTISTLNLEEQHAQQLNDGRLHFPNYVFQHRHTNDIMDGNALSVVSFVTVLSTVCFRYKPILIKPSSIMLYDK